MSNAFTVDVEDYFQVEAFSRAIDRASWDTYELRVERNTMMLLDLLDEHRVLGTFFVLGWVAQKQPALVREIADRGHEIASHGMSHRLIYSQTPEVFRDETRHSKQLLEDICQRPVVGYRAATYSITNRSLWALDILCEEGFSYDSSIFPMRHDRYGIPDAEPYPHLLTTPAGYRLVEFPISVSRFGRLKLPVAGGGYFRLFPYGLTRWGLRRINEAGHEFVFYLHPWEIDPDQPRIGNAGVTSRFRHYINLERTYSRLSMLLRDFSFTTMRNVLQSKGLLNL
jgi:polysaccharide deacetylase family protein (PEP-CTERM system associated)